jgi:hypothetical protein
MAGAAGSDFCSAYSTPLALQAWDREVPLESFMKHFEKEGAPSLK